MHGQAEVEGNGALPNIAEALEVHQDLRLTRRAGLLGLSVWPAIVPQSREGLPAFARQHSSRPLCAKQAWRFLAGWKSLPGKA